MLGDDGVTADAISPDDVFSAIQEAVTTTGRVEAWIEIDAPFAGKWLAQFETRKSKFETVLYNLLISTSTDLYGRSDWLVYFSNYVDPHDALWTQNRPHMYNWHSESAVFSDDTKMVLLKNCIFSFGKPLDSKPARAEWVPTED